MGLFNFNLGGKSKQKYISKNNLKTYDSFVSNNLKIINDAVIFLSTQANYLHKLNEDQITVNIISYLNGANINASHDTNMNGHVDILIKEKNFNFCVECKINDRLGLGYLIGGMDQLVTRYSTGTIYDSKGAFIIYHKKADLNSFIGRWKNHVETEYKNRDNNNGLFISSDISIDAQSQFNTIHKHPKSGLNYIVKHIPISLYHNPLN